MKTALGMHNWLSINRDLGRSASGYVGESIGPASDGSARGKAARDSAPVEPENCCRTMATVSRVSAGACGSVWDTNRSCLLAFRELHTGYTDESF